MTNPINPNYSGVTIQIANPAVYAGPGGYPQAQGINGIPQTYTGMPIEQQVPAQIQNPYGMTNPAQGQYAYPPQYYLNNYNYQGTPAGVQKQAEIKGATEEVKGLLPAPNDESMNNAQETTADKKNVKEYEVKAPEPQDLSKSQGVIDDLDARAAALEEEKKNAKDSKVVPLTDDYIKSLENYLNNPNEEIRLMASKEILTRLDEDKRRYDDPALNALLNKMLQDPSKLIRIASLSAFSSELASGNDYTIELLHNIQANPEADKEDVLQAADILLKMSQGKEVKDIPDPKVKEETKKG